jgi:hypothetical protein
MEKFTRITPEEPETVVTDAQTPGPAGETFQPPEPEQAQEQIRPQPQPPQMPQTITIPTQQFIQMQQQLAASKELKPLPAEAQTQEMSKRCAAPAVGHVIETRVIHQTQQITPNNFVEITQTLVLCVRCGASLAQIRASLGM